MHLPRDRKELLDDVLAEAAADFRAASLGETLRLARRRRRFIKVRRIGGSVAVLVAAGIFGWKNFRPVSLGPSSAPSAPSVAATNYTLIRTQALSPETIVSTHSLAAVQVIASVATVETIRTRDTETTLRIIDDRQLLALAGPRPAALVRIGPNEQRLIFTDPGETDAHP